jgi:hypothetical protein
VVGKVPVTHVEQYDPQAVIAGGLVELRELRRLSLHARYTRYSADPFTWPSAETLILDSREVAFTLKVPFELARTAP